MDKDERAFYERGWFTVLMLAVFFPVGLYLMWKYKKFNKLVRVLVTVGVAVYLVVWTLLVSVIMIAAVNEAGETKNTSQPVTHEVSTDHTAVGEELMTFANEISPELAEREMEIINLYMSVTGENAVDDGMTYKVMTDEMIPQYQKLIADVESVKFQTPELKATHELYIKGMNIQSSGFVLFAEALKTQDFDKVNEANEKLTEGRALLREYQAEIERLAVENGVELTRI